MDSEKEFLLNQTWRWRNKLLRIVKTWFLFIPFGGVRILHFLKGFIDRVFMPGFAFKSIENSVHWTKLLKGRSGRIIESMDAPMWFYEDVYKSPAKNSLSIAVMNYCGIKPVDYTVFRPIKGSTHEDRQAWISEVEELGKTDFNNLTEKSM